MGPGKIQENWIYFDDAFKMQAGYQYNGSVTLHFHVATTVHAVRGEYCYKKVSRHVANPILRPFRKYSDSIIEFGIHDRQDLNGFSSVCPFFRFTESRLKTNKKFNKVKITTHQEHELMLIEAREKAWKESHVTNSNFILEFLSKELSNPLNK